MERRACPMKYFVFMIFAFCAAGAFGLDSQNPQAMRWFKAGLKEKDPQKKIAAYAQAIELDSNFVEAYYNLALAYRQVRDYERAEQLLQHALATDPAATQNDTKLQITYELAATYKATGKTKQYENTLLEARALTQEHGLRNQINLELGRHYFEQQRYEEALGILRENGQLSGAEAEEYRGLVQQVERTKALEQNYAAALQAKNAGNAANALALFEQVRAAEPGYKDVEKQIAEVNAALQTGSRKQTLAALFEQAQKYERENNLEMALASYESLLNLDGSSLEARTKYQAAKQQLEKQQLAENLETEYEAGMNALRTRDWIRATLAFEKVLALDANYKEARSRLAEAQKALDRESKDTIVARYYAEGVAAINRKDLGEALVALERVSKLNPQYRNTEKLLRDLEASLSQTAATTAAPSASPVNVDSLYQAALTAENAQNWMHAVITFEQVALLAPNYRDVAARLENARKQLKLSESAQTLKPQTESPSAPFWENLGLGTLALILGLPVLGLIVFSPASRARYHVLRNNYSTAAAIYERILQRHPERTKLYPALANVYFLLGRRDVQALKVYKTILQLNLSTQNRERINAIVAEHYLTEGRTDSDAIEVLENALKNEQNKFQR